LVDWHVLVVKKNTTEVVENEVGVHKCTQQDFDEFYPVKESQKNIIETLKARKAFFCMDKLDKLGNEYTKNVYGGVEAAHINYDIVFRPCIPEQLTE
jgi:hypothetical protein